MFVYNRTHQQPALVKQSPTLVLDLDGGYKPFARSREISRSRFAASSKIGCESLVNEYIRYMSPLYRLEEEYKFA